MFGGLWQSLPTLDLIFYISLTFVPRVSKQLPSPEELSADVDVKALESSAALLGAKYIRKVKQVEASPGMSSPSRE